MEKQLMPQLRFPEFRDEWKRKKIEDSFEFKNGLNKEKEFFGRGTPIINFMDVYKLHSISKNDIAGLVELNESEIERYSAKKGDVFFTRTSETIEDIGMSATLIESIENCVFSGFVLRARPVNKDFIPEFTSYLFTTNSIRREITTKSSMTTRALTSGTLLYKVNFLFPIDKKEQKKIASFLSDVDAKITQLTKKAALLEQYKKGVIQKIFSQELRFKDDDGNQFPEWEEKKLGEVFKISAGGDINKINVSKEKTDVFKFPIFANSEKQKGLYGYSDIFKVDYECVTVTGRGSLGLAIARYETFYPIVRLLVLKPKIDLNVFFFENAINSINILSESTGVPQLTSPQLSSYKVKFPIIEEQTKIANLLSYIDAKMEALNTKIENSKAFKKGLLQQMFV